MQLFSEPLGDYLLITATGDRIDAAGAIQFKDNIRSAADRIGLDLAPIQERADAR